LLSQEWITLQNNCEQYEKGGLFIKLVSVVLTFAGLVLNLNAVLLAAMVALLWVQEGIFRTFQSRLGQRILQVEGLIRQGGAEPSQPPSGGVAPGLAFQLHSEWQASRKTGLGLLGEYATSACRPTVAFPYAVLVLGLMSWAL